MDTMTDTDSSTVSRNGQKHVTESGSKHLGEMDTMTDTDISTVSRNGHHDYRRRFYSQ